jgi:hypothetical protein
MLLLHQLGAVFFLVPLTMWLECGGIATLITWARRAVAGDIQKLGAFRSAALVVRFTAALRIRLVFFCDQLYDGWLWRHHPPVEVAHAGPDREHSWHIDV